MHILTINSCLSNLAYDSILDSADIFLYRFANISVSNATDYFSYWKFQFPNVVLVPIANYLTNRQGNFTKRSVSWRYAKAALPCNSAFLSYSIWEECPLILDGISNAFANHPPCFTLSQSILSLAIFTSLNLQLFIS